MENIILIGHGSPRNEANDLETLSRMLHHRLHPGCNKNCVKAAYLQYGAPGLPQAMEECVGRGATRIIIHPYFLASGVHVTRDIPELIDSARRKHPEVEFIYTDPLGIHERIIQVVIERINTARGLRPVEIEKRSFEIIEEEVDLSHLPADEAALLRRVIHATADLEFKDSLLFHPEAIRKGIENIRAGMDILTDVEMVRAGISRRLLDPWGGKLICRLPQEEGSEGGTRAEVGIETALSRDNNVGIVAIGNAPTALLKAIDIISSLPAGGSSRPLLIGVPVGFVKALEAKALLSRQDFPFITNLSRKGGSPVAAALVNGLLKLSVGG